MQLIFQLESRMVQQILCNPCSDRDIHCFLWFVLLCSICGALSCVMQLKRGQRWQCLRAAVLINVLSATLWFPRTEWTATSTHISLRRMKPTFDNGDRLKGQGHDCSKTYCVHGVALTAMKYVRCTGWKWHCNKTLIYLILKNIMVQFSCPILFFKYFSEILLWY